ncbi:MAG TPA: tripartite tricarboxylate transporter substrate binding protein [Xanthobacteraceae bacterium]|nr:tripartite tricarboxylate transporter substrate binding protein [Xanthobacteraceae bacterium]
MTKIVKPCTVVAPTRRQFVEGAAALGAATAFGTFPAFAQDKYPSRDVHVIAAFPAGSGADVFTRYFAENMKPFLGGNIIVENKVGASGNLALNHVARSKPDGYTILIHAPSSIAAAPSLFKDPGFDPEKAFDVLGSVCRLPFTISVSSKSPHKNMADLIAAVKAKGAKASYGTTAPTGQVAGAMMKNILKLEIIEVPYRTAADSVNDLDSGAIDYIMYDPIFALPRHRDGRARVLAITTKERMTTAPDIPTMHESGIPGVDVYGWWGAAVPKGVPEPVKEKIAAAFRQMAELPATKKWLADFGGDPWVVGPAEAQKQMLEDIKNWASFVRIANLEPKG